MWAIGIVMHEVLTCGKHPLFKPGKDSAVSYKQKLAKLTKLEAEPGLSWIAKNLFERLTMFKSH